MYHMMEDQSSVIIHHSSINDHRMHSPPDDIIAWSVRSGIHSISAFDVFSLSPSPFVALTGE